jgi:hypothetical protein
VKKKEFLLIMMIRLLRLEKLSNPALPKKPLKLGNQPKNKKMKIKTHSQNPQRANVLHWERSLHLKKVSPQN